MTTNPNFVRTLIGTVGALLLATVCVGTATGPAQAATVSAQVR